MKIENNISCSQYNTIRFRILRAYIPGDRESLTLECACV